MVFHRARDEKVGAPSENEARLYLIEAKGQWRKAAALCFKNRKAKVCVTIIFIIIIIIIIIIRFNIHLGHYRYFQNQLVTFL